MFLEKTGKNFLKKRPENFLTNFRIFLVKSISGIFIIYIKKFLVRIFVQIWDSTSGREMLNFKGHDQDVFTCMFSPANRSVVSCSADKTVKVEK